MGKMRIKRKKINYADLLPMEVYEYLLSGYIERFPANFVTRDNMKQIIREVILNREKLTREDICQKLNYDYLKEYKLRGSRRAFGGNIFTLVSYCFPEMEIKYWELNKVHDGFWHDEGNRREYMRWLIRKENVDPTKISDLKRITSRMIDNNNGRRARDYGGGVYNLILLVAKVDVKEWQVIDVPYWTKEKAVLAIKWLIEEKLKWTDEDIANNMSMKVFYNNGLGNLLKNYFRNNVIEALNYAYPGKFKRVTNNKIEIV